MADVASLPTKKLKQARISFGKLPKSPKSEDLDKENFHKGKINLENCIKVLHSKKSNEIEVKVDVHQTIQCPEITTSTNQTKSEIELPTEENVVEEVPVIDLTEENLTAMEEDLNNDPSLNDSNHSATSVKSIEETIDHVIYLAVNDSEALVQRGVDLARDKKRRRSPHRKSPENLKDLKSDTKDKNVSKDEEAEKVSELVSDEIEQKPKKPRRSIIDLLSVASAKKSENLESNENNELCNDSTDVIKMEVDNDDKNDVEIISVEKIKSTVVVTDEQVRTKDENSLTTPAKETAPGNKNISPNGTKNLSPNSTKPKSARKLDPEAIKKKELREKEREEKRKQKDEEKQQKEQERLELKRKREEERLQKEEEKKQKREELEKIKEEKLKKKMEELEKKKAELEAKRIEREQKEEERRKEREKKEQERKAKEDEKLRFQQEKLKLEEEKKKLKDKQASTFKNFFTSPGRSLPVKKVASNRVGNFIPFQLKENMFLAPTRRRKLTDEDLSYLDQKLNNQVVVVKKENLKKKSNRRKSVSTIPKEKKRNLSLFEDGLEFLMDDGSRCSTTSINSKPRKAKYLHFCENNRPPYYGTWSKVGCKVKPRQPYYKDTATFDYEVESEEEWEEPVDGEDIVNSDGEEEGEKDDEDEDDGFFVPHGYLSDDEGIEEEEDNDEMETEISEQKLKMKQQEFENAYKRKIKVLTPVWVGCVWPTLQEGLSKQHANMLNKYKMKFFVDTPIDFEEQKPPVKLKSSENTSKTENKPPKNKLLFPDTAIPDFFRLLHGNPNSSQKIAKEFQTFWELKNTNQLPSGKGPLNLNPQSQLLQAAANTDNPTLDQEISEITSNLVPNMSNSCKNSPLPMSISPQTVPIATQSPSLVTGVTLTANKERGPFYISKSQLLKKIKEVGAHGRKETLSRSCWFVLDAVFEKYNLDPANFPVPYQWGYITDVPYLKITEVGEIVTPPTPLVTMDTGMNISKFASKLSAESILENSSIKIKQEKEKEVMVQNSLSSIAKFTTTKVKAEDLIERSRQKIEKERANAPRRVELTTLPPPGVGSNSPYDVMMKEGSDIPPSVGNFMVPTHAAFNSFFKVKENAANCPAASPADNQAETMVFD